MAPVENNFPPRGPKIVLGRRLLGTDNLFGLKGKLALDAVERQCVVAGYQDNRIAVLFTDRLR